MLKPHKLLSRKILIALFFISIFVIQYACNSSEKISKSNGQDNYGEATFVGSETCKSCHDEEFGKWESSDHSLAMKLPDSITVKGDFNNTSFTHKGVTSKFFKKGQNYYMNTADRQGAYQDYKIVYTFGHFPLQQYVIAFPNGEYQTSIVAWDSRDNKWFHLQPKENLAHEDWLNWTGRAMSWNTMCADCHSTDLKKNFDRKTNTFHTSFSEINVGCEGCHGPMSNHNTFYEEHKGNYKGLTPPKMYMPTGLPSKELVDKCARCHSRRSQLTNNFDYTGEFADHYRASLTERPNYYEDGQVLEEDYVYGSFLQSKMYANDVSCRDCHDMHSMELLKTGNDLCMGCHEPKYNTPAHHFHEDNTDGASCINCHMPGKLFMGNDLRRDHSFRVPRPDHSVKYDVPNACNTCHADKDAKWASDIVVEKYGSERADHYSDHLLAGAYKDYHAFNKVINNKDYPEIARASAINQYSNNSLTAYELDALSKFINDSSALVRNETVEAFSKTFDVSMKDRIAPLLNDSVRLVRISAAKYFNKIRSGSNNITYFEKANKEYLDYMELNADFASGQHMRAVYFQERGNNSAAINAYKEALNIDSRYNRSRMNLALIYYNEGQKEEAANLYLKVVETEPESSYAYYMLGLLYGELDDSEKAEKYLKLATEKKPVLVNAFYNYMLFLYHGGNYKGSLQVANRALKTDPTNERILYAKFMGHQKLNQVDQAYETCNLLMQIDPNNQEYKNMFNGLKKHMKE